MEFTLIYRSKVIMSAYESWISPASKALDIGCGNAVVTDELRKHFGCQITGADILDYRNRDIPFKIMTDARKLPFANGEIDVAMFNDALHHCDDQEALLSEAARVAKAILLFEMEPTLAAKIVEVLINQIHNSNMNIPFNMHRQGEWEGMFRKLNLKYECRRIKKPNILYPFVNFAFRLER